MKTFYTDRLEKVNDRIQQLEYELDNLRTEQAKLEPLATAEREQFVAERQQKADDVLVEMENGLFAKAKDLLKIKNGELIVEVRKPKKDKEPKPEVEPEPEPEVEFIPVTEQEQAEIDKPISTPKKKQWLKSK